MSKLTQTKFWKVWRNMTQRCINRKHIDYHRYGGRGIKVSEEWLSYNRFEDDMYEEYAYYIYDNNKTPTLDRIDNNKGYFKENCRWVDMKVQSNNRRRSPREKLYTHNNQVKNLSEWERFLNFKRGTLKARINSYKWSFEKAITEKVDSRRYKR